jgi:hypothetical protein
MSPLAILWARDLEAVGPAPRPEGTPPRLAPHRRRAPPRGGLRGEERDGCQESVLPDSETSFGELSEIAQGPMQTVTIAGCPYVLLVTPFQD